MGVASAVGVLALCGGTLNPANLIAFPLILGVGVDNGVHVLNDYRRRTKRKPYELGFATGYGIFISALTTIVGFGTLMIARHKGLASLGLALAVGQAACMCTALLFLPALLGLLTRNKTTSLGITTKAALKRTVPQDEVLGTIPAAPPKAA
jgi:hypothetical protein